MSIQALRTALESRLQAMNGYLGDANTQFENGPVINPTNGSPYQVVHILFGETQNPEQSGRFFIENGFMQVTLRYPLLKGTGDVNAMAQKIRDWFYFALPLAAGGVTVIINKTPTIAPGAVDGDRYSVPVKIRFTANNAN